MICMLILDGQKKEAMLLEEEAHRQAALLTEEHWEILRMASWEPDEQPVMDIAYLDVTTEVGIRTAEQIRSRWKSIYMVLIVSEHLSPLAYLRPTIMAASVLLRPFKKEQAEQSIREAISYLPSEREGSDAVFVIADREGKLRLPYANILYFEARAKKIYAALEKEEYGFYDSMEHLLERLPSCFFRCHRGYVVNLKHLKRYQPTAGFCVVGSGIEIPVSRSYRQDMKERFADWKRD